MEKGPKKTKPWKFSNQNIAFQKLNHIPLWYSFMGQWVLCRASLGEGVTILCADSPEDGIWLVSSGRPSGQCCGSFTPEWNLSVISAWTTPGFTASSCLSLGLVPSWLSQTRQAWGSRPVLTFAWFPLHVTQTSHQPAFGEQAFYASVFPGPPPSLLDLSRSWVTRFTGSILGSDKPWLEGKGQKALYGASLSCGSSGDNPKAGIFILLSLFGGEVLI